MWLGNRVEMLTLVNGFKVKFTEEERIDRISRIFYMDF